MAKYGNSRTVFIFPRSPFYSVSLAALNYVPSERIIKLAQPNNKFISGIFYEFFSREILLRNRFNYNKNLEENLKVNNNLVGK